jgi:hypothetical protein
MLTMPSMCVVHLTALYVTMCVLVAAGHQQQVLAAPAPRPTTTAATCQGVPAEQRATIVYGVIASAAKFETRSMQHIRQWWTDSTRGAGEALAPGLPALRSALAEGAVVGSQEEHGRTAFSSLCQCNMLVQAMLERGRTDFNPAVVVNLRNKQPTSTPQARPQMHCHTHSPPPHGPMTACVCLCIQCT